MEHLKERLEPAAPSPCQEVHPTVETFFKGVSTQILENIAYSVGLCVKAKLLPTKRLDVVGIFCSLLTAFRRCPSSLYL
jgi:hypothetical protein